MIIVLLLVGVLVVFGLFGVLMFGGLSKIEHDQKAAEKNAATLLDQAFDGRPDVTFEIHMRSMRLATVVAGAKARGYTLAHQAGEPNRAMTLMFEKRS